MDPSVTGQDEKPASARRESMIVALVCFLFFLIFYGVTARGKLQGSDEAAVFATGVSLATKGSLTIDELEWLQSGVNIGAHGRGGHLYTKYFPGNILAVALVYKITARENDKPYIWVHEIAPSITGAKWALRLNAFWGSLGMSALLLLIRRYFSWFTTITTVLLVGLCTDWWYQSRGLYSEVAAGALLVASIGFAVREKPYRSAVALSLSILFRPTNLLGFPFWLRSTWNNRPRIIASGAILVCSGVIFAAYNWARFGSLFRFGYPSGEVSMPFLACLYNILLSPGRSLFVYSPVLLLAIPGAWRFYQREKCLTIISCLFVLAHAFVIASRGSAGWGLTWGARLMTPAVPVLGFLCASSLDWIRERKFLLPVPLLLGAAGLFLQIIALLRDPTHVLLDNVNSGTVKVEDTIYSIRQSWPALQIGMLKTWQPCDLDSRTLRGWFTNCPE